jgi:hypothetical protein
MEGVTKYARCTVVKRVDSSMILSARDNFGLVAETQREIDIAIGLQLVKALREYGPLIIELDSKVKDELDVGGLWKHREFSNVAHTIRIEVLGHAPIRGDGLGASPKLLDALQSMCRWALSIVK